MAIASYAELLTAIQNYEDDASSIVSERAAEWVTLAEQRIHYGSGQKGLPFYSPPVRVRAMESNFTLRLEATQDGGTSGGTANAHSVSLASAPTLALGLTIEFTAGNTNTGATTMDANSTGAVAIRKGDNNDALEAGDIILGATYVLYHDGTYYKLMPAPGAVPLPARFLGFRNIYEDGTTRRPLDFLPAQHLHGTDGANSTGRPIGYTIDGDAIVLVPPSDGTKFIRGSYHRRFAALSTELNELFRRAPGVYLYGSLLEAALYLGENDNAVKWHGNFMAACAGVNGSDQRDRYGSAPLAMRAPGPVYP